MKTKICYTCKEKKSTSDFSSNKCSPDGYRYQCKLCSKKYRERWLKTIKGQEFLIRDRQRWKDYYQENKKKVNDRVYTYQTKQKETPIGELKFRAGQLIRYLKRKGKIISNPCCICGDENTQGHHPDYSKPLEVAWLCSKHHKEVHYGKRRLNLKVYNLEGTVMYKKYKRKDLRLKVILPIDILGKYGIIII